MVSPACGPLRRHLLPLAMACSVAQGTCAAQPGRAPDPARGPGRRIILLALDAADWRVIDPLVASGKLPAFARLRSAGRTGVLQSTPPLLSPIIWTTIATGRQPEDHGVLDFMVDLPSGGQAPIAATSRRVPALWNILSDAGRRVAVVGWWATWPAEAVSGVVVSDRVAPQLTRPGSQLDPQAIAPASEAKRLAPAIVRAGDVSYDDVAAYVPLTRAEYESALAAVRLPGGQLYQNRLAHLAAVVAATRTYSRLAEAILAAGQPDLLAVYLEGIDTVSHLFVREPQRGPAAIEAAYRDADALLARLAAASAPDTWIVVCSDHGFEPPDAGVAEDPADLAGPAAAWHRPYGMVAVAEAGALARSSPAAAPPPLPTVTPLDVAPTLLHLAGLAVSAEMPGRVVAEMLPDEAARRPVTRVASYAQARGGTAPPAPGEADAEVRARLQALGYVGTAPTSLARQNLGEILYRRGNLAGAERELRAVVEAQPGNLTAHLWLAKTLRGQDRPREALRVYERALALPGGVAAGLVEAVDLAAQARWIDDARRVLAGVHAADAPALHTARAIVAEADGQGAVAERELRAALASDPTSFEALSRLLDLLIAARRPRDFLPLAKDAAQRATGSPRHVALLGETLLATGAAAAAEGALKTALALAPDSTAVRLDIARAQVAQGHGEAALATLDGFQPSVDRSILLGAAFALLGRWPEAAAQYRDAIDRGHPTPQLLNGLAWAQMKQGKTAEAAELLARSLALDKSQPEIGRLLAEIRTSAEAR